MKIDLKVNDLQKKFLVDPGAIFFHPFPVTFLPTFETLSILFDVTASGVSLGTSLISFNLF
jgi:hypothetical protein